MPKKSIAEVATELASLKELKPHVRRFSGFGDDNHEAIDAQLEVLEQQMTEDDVHDLHADDSEENVWLNEHVFDAALETARWLAGTGKYTPCNYWDGLVSA